MKVAYIGNFEPQYSTENDVRKAFEALGHSVKMLQEDKIDPEILRAACLESDLVLWTSTWDAAQPFEYTIGTLRLCGMKNIPTCTLHLDVFFGSDRGDRSWWMNPMFFTAYCFTADGDHQSEFERLGVNHQWLPPAVRHDAAHPGNFRLEYKCDVAFVGSNGVGYHESVWPYRRELVTKLHEICARRGWSFRNPGGELDKPNAGKVERGEDMNDFYASAQVTIGDSLCLKKEHSRYYSDRAHEATGRNGFLIMPKINVLKDEFDGNIPMYSWGDFEQLEEMIEYYLAEPEQREQLRDLAHVITKNSHTYKNRAQLIIDTVRP